ncbi:putative transcriptional regulator [Bacillus sp. TS-2]|nr:putative transcriptional regulator [Bacillus sp. TS-2]
MAEENTDIRSLRTRQFIINSFTELLEKKDFNKIKISDITSGAMINRSTFYRHFLDKYDLLQKLTKEDLMKNVIQELSHHKDFNEEMLKNVFLSITKYHMSHRCQRSQDMELEAILKKELEQIIFQALLKKYPNEDHKRLRIIATMLSWMIYGASMDWKQNSSKSPEDYYEYANSSIRQLINID